jgi:hypothetical protein
MAQSGSNGDNGDATNWVKASTSGTNGNAASQISVDRTGNGGAADFTVNADGSRQISGTSAVVGGSAENVLTVDVKPTNSIVATSGDAMNWGHAEATSQPSIQQGAPHVTQSNAAEQEARAIATAKQAATNWQKLQQNQTVSTTGPQSPNGTASSQSGATQASSSGTPTGGQ